MIDGGEEAALFREPIHRASGRHLGPRGLAPVARACGGARRIDLSLAAVDLRAAIDDSTKRAAVDVLFAAADRGADVAAASLDDLGFADRRDAGGPASLDDLYPVVAFGADRGPADVLLAAVG